MALFNIADLFLVGIMTETETLRSMEYVPQLHGLENVLVPQIENHLPEGQLRRILVEIRLVSKRTRQINIVEMPVKLPQYYLFNTI